MIKVMHNGVQLGVVRGAEGRWVAYLQGGGAAFDARLPGTHPTPGDAIAAVRDAHEPDDEPAATAPEYGGES